MKSIKYNIELDAETVEKVDRISRIYKKDVEDIIEMIVKNNVKEALDWATGVKRSSYDPSY